MKLCSEFVDLDTKVHLVKEFDCGKKEMNEFLQRFASKHEKKGISKTLVLAVDTGCDEKRQVAAYYTISVATVSREEIPVTGLPKYPIPVTLLARLAIDKRFQRRRLGSKVLISALRHTVKLADAGMPTVGVAIDVLDSDALKFYQSFNFFYDFTNDPMRLYAPMVELKEI
jgi:GNAT superfamily N-acetyltransferase